MYVIITKWCIVFSEWSTTRTLSRLITPCMEARACDPEAKPLNQEIWTRDMWRALWPRQRPDSNPGRGANTSVHPRSQWQRIPTTATRGSYSTAATTVTFRRRRRTPTATSPTLTAASRTHWAERIPTTTCTRSPNDVLTGFRLTLLISMCK